MSALTTQFLFKRWTNQKIPPGGDDQALQAMIDLASAAIERRLERTFEVGTFREWHNGTGTRTIQVKNQPIVAVYGMATSSSDAMTLTNSGAQYAACSTSDTGLTLFSVVGGVEVATTILWTSATTLNALAAAVAQVSGWSASVLSNYGTKSTTLLRPRLTGYCVQPDTFTLEIADQFDEVRQTDQTERSIERRHGSPFPVGLSNVFLWYRAGYTLPVDNTGHTELAVVGNLPLDLTQGVNAVVKAVVDGSDELLGGAQGGTIGGYNYYLAQMGGAAGRGILGMAIDENMRTFMPYRNVRVTW